MARSLEITVGSWLGDKAGKAEDVTFGELSVRFNEPLVVVTEIREPDSSFVRPFVRVPAIRVAEWLLCNWWRILWEPKRDNADWRLAHCMNAIGGGLSWPPLKFVSDGELVEVEAIASPPSSKGIRFLNSASRIIPIEELELAFEEFIDCVADRLRTSGIDGSELHDLRQEIWDERADPELANLCRLQAIAGIDPDGEKQGDWARDVDALIAEVGDEAIAELMAVLPDVGESTSKVRQAVSAIGNSTARLSFGDLPEVDVATSVPGDGPSWLRGYKAAQMLRRRLALGNDRFRQAELEGLVKFQKPSGRQQDVRLFGALRRSQTQVPCVVREHPTSQRFDLARLVYCHFANPGENLLAVTDAITAHQKAQRAFAAEFLCPAEGLNEFVEREGSPSQSTVDDAAAYFGVSSMVVQNQALNHANRPGFQALAALASRPEAAMEMGVVG